MERFRLRPDAIKKDGQWVGVLRRVPIPDQVMTVDDTELEDWFSEPCGDDQARARQLAMHELAKRQRDSP